MSTKQTILMVVGASGGHIYPAVAVADKLTELSLKQVHFVHSGSVLGRCILSSFSYPIHEISIGNLAKEQSLFQTIKTILQLPITFIQAVFLIKKIKADVIFGTGGAVTGPVIMAGLLMGRKVTIWEGNKVMGLANRLLAFFVSRIFTVFPLKKFHKKQTVCAYPLRKQILSSNPKLPEVEKDVRLDHFNKGHVESQKNIFKVLILGGSQGSVFLNQVVSEALEEENWRKDIFIYHQTGDKSLGWIQKKYKSFKGVEAFAFCQDIERYYKKSDLIFSRAGSGAIWEMAFYSKALVLIPLTYSAGGHQLHNAKELYSKSLVEMIQERDFNVKSFKDKLIKLKQNEEKRKQLAKNLKMAYKGNGIKPIVDWIVS